MVATIVYGDGTLVDHHGHEARPDEEREGVEDFVDLLTRFRPAGAQQKKTKLTIV